MAPAAVTRPCLCRWAEVGGLVLTLCALAACGSTDSPALPSSVTIAPPPQAQPPRQAATEAAVTRSYERFWTVSRSLPQRPVTRWRPELHVVAAGPMAETILVNLARQRTQGVTLYGEIEPRINEVRVEGEAQAVVIDCQDASRSGQANAATGKPRTVGLARNLVSGTLERGPDGAWRVTRVDYPEGSC